MAKQISSLSVGLFGDIGNFAQSFSKDAVAEVNSFVGGITSAGAKLASFAGIGAIVGSAVAGIGAAIGSAFEVKEQFGIIDETAKLSDRLGITTEALTGFQHAAEISGVSADELTGGFEKMFKTLGEAVSGSKEAVATFQSLGLSAQNLQAESPDIAFKTIAEAISHIANPAQRAAAAMDVFGKSGQTLIPLLNQGEVAIGAMQAEAGRLGITFSRLDASKIEHANEAVNRLKSVFTGFARTAAIALAPLAQFGADGLTSLFSKIAPKLQEFAADFTQMVPKIEAALSNLWGYIGTVWDGIYNYLASVGGEIYSVVAANWDTIVSTITAAVLGAADVVSAAWGVMTEVAGEAWSAVSSIVQGAGSTINDTVKDITIGLNVAEYAIQHWADFFELVGTQVDLAVVQTANEIQYALQEVAATYVAYALTVMATKIGDFVSYTATVLENLGKNIASFFSNLPGLISGKTDWSQVWTPLTKGFQETVVQWPGIADREKGELEKQLEDENDFLTNNFAEGLAQHLTQRETEAKTTAQGVSDFFKNLFNFKSAPALKPPAIEKPGPLVPTLNPSTLGVTIEPKLSKALRAGSAEAQALAFQFQFPTAPPPPRAVGAGAPIPPPNPTATDTKNERANQNAVREQTYLDKIEKNTRQPVLAVAKF